MRYRKQETAREEEGNWRRKQEIGSGGGGWKRKQEIGGGKIPIMYSSNKIVKRREPAKQQQSQQKDK